jgi:hypothetical protein
MFQGQFLFTLGSGYYYDSAHNSETSTSGCQRTAQAASWRDPPTMFVGPEPSFVQIVSAEFGIMFAHHM